MKLFRFLSFFFLWMSSSMVFGQPEIAMADRFREEGKIYVVVATIGLILAGVFIFLIWLEKRISTLEKQQNHEN